MHIIFTDETNRDYSKDYNFFVYGGLFFPIDQISVLDNKILQIRCDAGYSSCDILKFDTRSRPTNVSKENAAQAKEKVIEACLQSNCKFIVYVISHKILTRQKPSQYILWAADYVIGRFNYYLENEVDDIGLCIIDNLPTAVQYKYLSDKFMIGLSVKDKIVPLSRIKSFSSTCIGASHVNSAMDIVLGSFRYCINNPKNKDIARHMMKNVVSLMWHTRDKDNIYLEGKGMILRPDLKELKYPLKKEYEDLINWINELIS
jgi:hypothetical protein